MSRARPKMPKEVKLLLVEAEEQGFTWRFTKRCHVQVLNEEGRVVAGSGGTPGDRRSLLNFRAALRRAGVNIA